MRSPTCRRGAKQRDQAAVDEALARLQSEAKTDANLMAATLAAVRAGATVGEWAGALREVFGEYRAPTGVSGVASVAEAGAELAAVRERVRATGDGSAPGCGSWSASRVSTVIPTGPSRSRCAHETPDSRSSTRESG
ncbi:methylmalonyl-CoA mutase family protein [Aeromicrobium sp. UC242_57]|uniref:methylmalonyl-CoA mutase family protein n=1 Tax=Aeromicrobium sp. UC242_57 TaxID=3374624 RepID=UPI0037B85E95